MGFCTADGSPLGDKSEAETLKMHPAGPTFEKPAEVTFINKTEVVEIGGYVDFELPQTTLRVNLKGIVQDEFREIIIDSLSKKEVAAQLSITNTNGIIHGGVSTKMVRHNEYLVPVAPTEHFESHSLYFFFLSEDLNLLFRLLVTHINTHTEKVELSLGYFRYEKAKASQA